MIYPTIIYIIYYTLGLNRTQLQSLAKNTEILNKVTSAVSNPNTSEEKLILIGKSYTTETLKTALAQSNLKKAQIKTILSASGLHGKLLKTTAAEIANAAAANTLAKEQSKAAASSLSMGGALKGLGIRMKEAAASFLAFLSAHPMGWVALAAGAIAGIVAGIKQYRQHISEAAAEARQTADEITNSYRELNSSVSGMKHRYAELAQGINQVTGENEKLTTEEYTEFLNLSNQLAELFPSLTRSYNDNGDAILNLSGDVNTITGSLNRLVEAEKALAEQEIMDKMPDILKGYNQDYSDMLKELTRKKEWQDKLQTAYDSLQDIDKLYNSRVYNSDDVLTLDGYHQTREVLRELGIAYSIVDESTKDPSTFGLVSFSLTDYEEALKEISSALHKAEKDVSNYNNKIKAENADFNKYLNTWLTQDWAYISLQDSDMQNVIREMLFNTDWLAEARADGVNTGNWDEVSEWLEENYILAIANIDDSTVKSALSELYSPPSNNETVQEYTDRLDSVFKAVRAYCNKNGIKLPLGIENQTDTINELTDIVKAKLHDAFDYKVGELTFEELQIAANLKISENGFLTWDGLIARIEEAKHSIADTKNFIPDISSSISTIATQLAPQFTELGRLYSEIFRTDGNGNEIFSLDSIDNNTLESLRKSFAEIGEEIGVTFDPSQLEPFFAVLTNGGSETEVQQAFNDLATAYLYSTGTLEQLNNETAKAIQKQLEQMGVTNAEAVVTEALALKNEELALSKKYLAENGSELTEATDSETLAFMAEQAEAGNCSSTLAALQLQKLLANETLLDTEADINNVMALAKASGIATGALSELIRLKAVQEKAEAEGITNTLAYSMLADRIRTLQQDFQDEVTNFQFNPVSIEYKAPDSSKSSSSSSASKQAETDWKALLDKETDLLEKQLAANLITFKEYTDKRRQITEDYYRDGKIKAEEYYDALESMYANQLSLHDRAVNAVTDRLDEEIDRLKKQKEAIENSYQVRIDAIQGEIDALNKANDARKEQIDLEKAQYEAERARNQRVNRIYNGGQFIYEADMEAVRDAEDDLADKEIRLNISCLETQVESLKAEMENATKSLDIQIEALESYKDKWNEISAIYAEQQDKLIAAEIMGSEWERDVLNGRLDTLRSFTEQYIALQQAQADAAANAARIRADANAGNTAGGKVGDTPYKQSLGTTDGKNPGKDDGLPQSPSTSTIGIGTAGFNISSRFHTTMARFHGGLDEGYATVPGLFAPAGRSLSILQKLAGENLLPNELPAILQHGELVITPEQQHNIIANAERYCSFSAISNGHTAPYSDKASQIHIDSLTISCPNVTNHSGAEYILKSLERLPLDNIQHSHRRK